MTDKTCNIISGGTVNHVRPHLALCAPAYGTTGRMIQDYWNNTPTGGENRMLTRLWETRMAGGRDGLETNADVARLLDILVEDPLTKVIFMPVALCDFVGAVATRHDDPDWARGKAGARLKSDRFYEMHISPAAKIIGGIRAKRKDIFLVGFKTTADATEDEQFHAGLKLVKTASCNLVLANDIRTRVNMIITPEEARYCVTTERAKAIRELVQMTWLRSQLTFTRSTVVDGQPVPWSDERVPANLRAVVNGLIQQGAYKPGPTGATVGHFAAKLDDNMFLTSIRKTNFNDIDKLGMVLVMTDGPDSVIAYGMRPSVGGQSQRIVFREHPGMDCIVHAHVPIKSGSKVPQVSQREYECGSHECGANTSRGLGKFMLNHNGGDYCVYAVYLKQHGPNIVFSKTAPPELVLSFIEANFDLSGSTSRSVE